MEDLNVADSGSWSLGTLIWLPSAVVLLVLIAMLARWCWSQRHDSFDGNLARNAAIIGGPLLALIVVLGTAWGMYPYKAEYHQWRDVSGTVDSIDSRLIGGSDGGAETKFVVVIDGRQFACDDTRCAAVREGDRISLSCKRAWQYTGTDGYDCRFVSTKAAGR